MIHKTTLNSEIETQGPSVTSQAWKGPDVHPLVFQYRDPFYLFSFTKWWSWGRGCVIVACFSSSVKVLDDTCQHTDHPQLSGWRMPPSHQARIWQSQEYNGRTGRDFISQLCLGEFPLTRPPLSLPFPWLKEKTAFNSSNIILGNLQQISTFIA